MDITLLGMIFSAAVAARGTTGGFSLRSDAFPDSGAIPTEYTYHGVAGGKNISLPLQWNGTPAGTRSFALSIIDPHPVAKNWVHWFAINIPADATSLPAGASGSRMPHGTIELDNTYGTRGYGGPEPPKGSGAHPYVVTLYALNVDHLDLKPETGLKEFQAALQGKVVGSATITGMYER